MLPSKMPKAKTARRKDGDEFSVYAEGGKVKSRVNEAGNYTKPELRKRLFEQIKAQEVQGTKAGQWSARKAQLLAKRYKDAGGGYK
jgi:sulfite reductase beta subunit-like hemoprotein